MSMKEITYAQAINEAMSEEMRRDENVFMMGEDIAEYCGAFGVSRGMLEEFGKERIMNTPSAVSIAGLWKPEMLLDMVEKPPVPAVEKAWSSAS